MDTNSRDKIIAVERKRYRWRTFWSFVGVLVGFGGAVLTALAEHKYPLPRLLIDDPAIAFFGGTFFGLAIIILALFYQERYWIAFWPGCSIAGRKAPMPTR